MKKTLSIGLALIAIGAISLFIINFLPLGQGNAEETFLLRSQSPEGTYQIEAYRTEPGATVDFSVKAYLVNGQQKELIYNAYHESEAKVAWLDDAKVSINDKTLDLSHGETYDWRKP